MDTLLWWRPSRQASTRFIFGATAVYTLAQEFERALRAGAMGFLAKDHAAEEVLTAIRTVLRGEVYLERAVSSRLLRRFVGGARNASEGLRT